ncbi:MAG TPA: type II toxin-antitoxin system VapC family toxin [Solirubrobacterales bacterium]|nr:type II toxin-antitoxin system VapC family toxin [Solirubrobacterales bacterium]
MRLYVDSSALVKRYVAEPGAEEVREAMTAAGEWVASRIAFTEVVRALGAGDPRGSGPVSRFRSEWPSFLVVDVDQRLAEEAAELALEHGTRTLDSLHLASALAVAEGPFALATWDARLWEAARRSGLALIPGRAPRD